MKIQNVKGGYDFLRKEQKIRDYINNVMKNKFYLIFLILYFIKQIICDFINVLSDTLSLINK